MVVPTLIFLAARLMSHPSCPGSGAVYHFDPVGSYEREACRAAGAAQSLVQPFLDNQVCFIASEFCISSKYMCINLTPDVRLFDWRLI